MLASLETFDGAKKKPFKATGLLNKSQLKLASYIKANKDVTLQGTKRFTDKSGEYYLKNVQLQNRRQDPNSTVKGTLNNPQNLENCLNRDVNFFNNIRRRASKIVTLLPENSLTPIPKKEGIHRAGIANKYGKRELDDAQRTAVFIRRLEYATSMKKQMNEGKNLKNNIKKIALIQEWWKTMYKIIKLQKNMRGFLFRKKLMNNLEHQEKLLQFITEFDNIHNYHLYRQFMDNLKKKRDYEKAKLMEKCEDFNDKLDNLEKMRDLKNFKKCFDKWRDDTKRRRKEALDNLANTANDVFNRRRMKNNLDVIRKIRDTCSNINDKLDDQAKAFRDRNARKKFLEDLIKAHRLNKIISDLKKEIDDRLKKEALDKLKRNDDIGKAAERLNKLMEDRLKRDTFDDLKTMDFVDKVDDVINKHNDKIDNEGKRDFLKKLKDIYNRNKYTISSGVNDFELIADKKPDNKPKNQIFSTSYNDFNFQGTAPKLKLEKDGFSLIAPEMIKFEFGEPQEKCKQISNEPINKQVDALDKYRKRKDRDEKLRMIQRLNDILTKAQKESDDQLKKDVLDKLKRNNDIINNLNKLDDLINNKKKNNALRKFMDNLKKISDAKKALDHWRKVKDLGDILDKLIDYKKKNKFTDKEKQILIDKYKKKMMQVLLNIYQRQRHLLMKKYLDRWKKAKGPESKPYTREPKYKKKPRIGDLSDEETSFNPQYYNPKKNIYSQNTAPAYKKRISKKPYEPEDFYFDYTDNDGLNPIDYSETSSINESAFGTGVNLIPNRKVIKQPRNYTSQSFFIDKNNGNNITNNNYQMATHKSNQLPMTMKGDFVSLIEQNPKIMAQKNPRIQVTNATCDLKEIINNEGTEDELNPEEVNHEMNKLNNNYLIDKNRVLSKVIKNCDKDLYASQKPFKAKKDQWYSVSIPLNDNEAKWEFLNNIKGERDKNNMNKFELIQKEDEPIKEEIEENGTPLKRNRSEKKNIYNKDNSYRLREMNYSQFYRSPLKTPKIEEEEKSLFGNRIKRPGERQRTYKGMSNSNSRFFRNNRIQPSYNIERSRGKIELDPKYRSIDYGNRYGDFEDSDD